LKLILIEIIFDIANDLFFEFHYFGFEFSEFSKGGFVDCRKHFDIGEKACFSEF